MHRALTIIIHRTFIVYSIFLSWYENSRKKVVVPSFKINISWRTEKLEANSKVEVRLARKLLRAD